MDGKYFEQIMVTDERGVTTVTLNRPDCYNALGSRIVEELREVLEEIESSGHIRVMILTGAGERDSRHPRDPLI